MVKMSSSGSGSDSDSDHGTGTGTGLNSNEAQPGQESRDEMERRSSRGDVLNKQEEEKQESEDKETSGTATGTPGPNANLTFDVEKLQQTNIALGLQNILEDGILDAYIGDSLGSSEEDGYEGDYLDDLGVQLGIEPNRLGQGEVYDSTRYIEDIRRVTDESSETGDNRGVDSDDDSSAYTSDDEETQNASLLRRFLPISWYQREGASKENEEKSGEEGTDVEKGTKEEEQRLVVRPELLLTERQLKIRAVLAEIRLYAEGKEETVAQDSFVRPPPSTCHLFKVYSNRLLQKYQSPRHPYKRLFGIALLFMQYALALLTIIFDSEDAVISAYGSVTAFNGILAATQLFYFQVQPVVANESLFDIVFLTRLLFFTDETDNSPRAQGILLFGLACAWLSVLSFLVSYWMCFPQVKSFTRLQFQNREQTEISKYEPIAQFLAFTLTDTADFVIVAARTLLLETPVDTKVVLFVVFLLLNPLISQLGTYMAIRAEEKQDLALPPKMDTETPEQYLLRQEELERKIEAVKSAERRQDRKNTALTGILAMLVFPVLYTVVLALSGSEEAKLIVSLVPLYSALPLWAMWKILAIPWDRYFFMNDSFRDIFPRGIVVVWGVFLVIFAEPSELLVAATLLMYSLVPLLVLLFETVTRRSRTECLYHESKVFDDGGTVTLFRSRTQDRLKYIVDPPSAYYSRARKRLIGAKSQSERFLEAIEVVSNLVETDLTSALETITFIVANCFERSLDSLSNMDNERKEVGTKKVELNGQKGAFANVAKQRTEDRTNKHKGTYGAYGTKDSFQVKDDAFKEVLTRIEKLEARLTSSYQSQQNRGVLVKREWYLWSEVQYRLLGGACKVDLWEVVREEPETRISSLEMFETKKLTVSTNTLDTLLVANKWFLRAMNFRKADLCLGADQSFGGVRWYLSKGLRRLNLRLITLGDVLGKAIVERLPWQLEALMYVLNTKQTLQLRANLF